MTTHNLPKNPNHTNLGRGQDICGPGSYSCVAFSSDAVLHSSADYSSDNQSEIKEQTEHCKAHVSLDDITDLLQFNLTRISVPYGPSMIGSITIINM